MEPRSSRKTDTRAHWGPQLLILLLLIGATATGAEQDPFNKQTGCLTTEKNGPNKPHRFPTPVSALQPICSTVLECEVLEAQPVSPGDSELAEWLRGATEARTRRACDLARLCYAKGTELVKPVEARNARQDPPYPIFHPDWRSRAWAAELAASLHADSRSPEPVGEDGKAKCPLIATKNHLRRPITDRLDMAMELTRHIYGTQCDTVLGCLRVATGAVDPWEQEHQWKAELADRDEKAITAEVAATIAVEQQMEAQREVMADQVIAIDAHGQTVSEGQQIAAVTLAEALNDGLRTGKSLNEIAATASGRDTSTPKRDDDTGDLNLTDATLLVAQTNETVATSLKAGLSQIAAAISGSSAQAPTSDVRRQIDPEADLDQIYPQASRFGYAILLLPDPRIPRHRRGYDLTLDAVNRGMLDSGFVLDRYAMPWQDYIDSVSNGKIAVHELASQGIDDGKFGILVFRRDRFRTDSGTAFPEHDLRVLYVVAESATYGVQGTAFARALSRVTRVSAVRATDCPHSTDCSTGACDAPAHFMLSYQGRYFDASGERSAGSWDDGKRPHAKPRVLVVGPAFSGSLSSIENARKKAEKDTRNGGLTSQSDLRRLRNSVAGLRTLEWRNPGTRASLARHRAVMEEQIASSARDLMVSGKELAELENFLQKHPEWPDKAAFRKAAERISDCPQGSVSGPLDEVLGAILAQREWSDPSPKPTMALRLVSATTTASSNYKAASDRLVHHSLAIPDTTKLDALHERFPSSCGSVPCTNRDVVIFSENSTFGKGLCPANVPEPSTRSEFCRRAFEISFPANIADIRARRNEQERDAQKQASDVLSIPYSDSFLDLAQGAENGSEFPDSQRSILTSATSERELEAALRRVTGLNPRLVVVAATDVRDRIFLFDRLRRAAPRALLVDLEADVLLSHPRIIHATRGMLLLSSGNLQGAVQVGTECNVQSSLKVEQFANDDQWALHSILTKLRDSPAQPGCTTASVSERSKLYGYLPSRGGLKWGWSHDIDKPNDQQKLAGVERSSISSTAAVSRIAALVLAPVAVLALLTQVRRLAYKKQDAPYLARVVDSRFDWRFYVLVWAVVVVLIWFAQGSFRINLDPNQPSPYLYGPDTGLGWAVALSLGAIIGIVLWHCRALCTRYWALVRSAGAEPADGAVDTLRPGLISATAPSRRFLPGADMVSWPLYLVLLIWIWLAAGSTQGTLCVQCWPRTSVLGSFAELLLLLTVIALLFVSIRCGGLAVRSLRLLLESSARAHVLLGRGGVSELKDWHTYPPLHERAIESLTPPDDADRQPATWVAGIASDARADRRNSWLMPNFARTPFLARPGDFSWPFAALLGGQAKHEQVREQLRLIDEGYTDSLGARLALGLYFATLIADMRLRAIASILAASCVVAIGYLYPVTDRDQYLMLALGLMLLQVIFISQAVLALERAPVISRLLCNTPRGLELNWPTIASIATPVLVLLGALFVIEMPGVLEWSEGLLGWVLGWFKG